MVSFSLNCLNVLVDSFSLFPKTETPDHRFITCPIYYSYSPPIDGIPSFVHDFFLSLKSIAFQFKSLLSK